MADSDITQKKAARTQADAASRERDELFRVLMEHANDFIRIHELDGRSVYASPSVERLYGRVPTALFEFAHPDDVEAAQRWWKKVLDGATDRLCWRVRDAAGQWRHLETSAALVQYHKKPHVLTICRDITDRKRAEVKLRESDELLRLLTENTGEFIRLFDPAGNLVYANPSVERLLGAVPPDFPGFPHTEDVEASKRWFERVMAGSKEFLQWRVRAKNGEWRWMESQGAVVSYNGIPHVLTVCRDVTDRCRAEQAQRAAEQRLHHVVASSPAVLFAFPIEDGEIRAISWMSENIEAILGYRVDETLEAGWWLSNIQPEDREKVVKQFRSDILGSEHSYSEYQFRHKDARYRWIRSETRVLRDAAGQATEVVGSLWDITERKRLEDQFRQAQKMEALGHLAGGVAHDFNNLLTIISGYSEILLPDLPPADPGRELIAEIQQAAERAAGLTRQLLAFSRQTVLEPRLLDLNGVVRENEKLLRRLIGEDVHLTAVLDPDLERVEVDPGQISQVILNLAVNARDAMPTGGKLTIETGNVKLDEASVVVDPQARPGRHVLLAVADTGTGMTPEVRAHIFEPFFTTKGLGKGTGLGLATVYGIVKQSGGFISVYSEPGRGTAFKIYFPVAEERLSTAKTVPAVKHTPRGTETILLVEDEDAVRTMMRVVLQRAGYELLEASRGAEAIRLAREHPKPVHLLITDVVMPEMGGRELAERLAPERPGLKVLYLSGYTDDAVLRHGVLQADVAFLQKPFTIAALTNKVRQVLDEAGG